MPNIKKSWKKNVTCREKDSDCLHVKFMQVFLFLSDLKNSWEVTDRNRRKKRKAGKEREGQGSTELRSSP